MLVEHYILTRSRYFAEVCTWVESRGIAIDLHLNRCRFSIDSDSPVYTEFLLRWAGICPCVDPSADLATGNINLWLQALIEDYSVMMNK